MPFLHRYRLSLILADMDERGWRQADLARAAGLSESNVSRFLSGKLTSSSTGRKIAEALGHPPRRYLVRARRAR